MAIGNGPNVTGNLVVAAPCCSCAVGAAEGDAGTSEDYGANKDANAEATASDAMPGTVDVRVAQP